MGEQIQLNCIKKQKCATEKLQIIDIYKNFHKNIIT